MEPSSSGRRLGFFASIRLLNGVLGYTLMLGYVCFIFLHCWIWIGKRMEIGIGIPVCCLESAFLLGGQTAVH